MKKILLPLLMIIAATTSLVAQDESLSKTVEVLRAYKPTLPDAYKLTPVPHIDDTAAINVKFAYPLRNVRPLVDGYSLTPIPPARVQREQYYQPDAALRGYLRLGLGFKLTTMLDAYVGSERAKNFVWDAYANHYGNYGDVKNKAKEKVPTLDMRNEIGASAQYNFKHSLLYANAGFKQHYVRYYGYDVDTFNLNDYKALSKDQKQQYFNKIFAKVRYLSVDLPDTTWAYGGEFNFYDYRSVQPKAEDALKFNLYASKDIRPSTTVGLRLGTDVYIRNSALAENSNAVISVEPQAKERHDWWEATAKLNFLFDNVSGSVKPYCFPTLNFTALLTDGIFLPYVEISGKHYANTFEKLTTENPYLRPDTMQEMRNTRNVVSFIGGIKGKLGSMLSYNVGLEYAFLNDMYFYVTDTAAGLGNYFDVAYDDVKRFTFSGNLRFQPTRAWDVEYALRYDSYKMDELAKPYNRPAFTMSLCATYNLWNKLNFYGGLNVYGKYTALSYTGQEVKRGSGVDMNLGASYSFFNRSSVFLQFNNIFASRYQVFSGYPTYGFNALIGYTLLF